MRNYDNPQQRGRDRAREQRGPRYDSGQEPDRWGSGFRGQFTDEGPVSDDRYGGWDRNADTNLERGESEWGGRASRWERDQRQMDDERPRYGSQFGSGGFGREDGGFYRGSQQSDDRYGSTLHHYRGEQFGVEGRFGGQGQFRGKGPKGYQRSDDRLREVVCERLMDAPDIDASEVTVSVSGQTVTLEGTVDSLQAKYDIEECAERAGSRDVVNNIRVKRESRDMEGNERSQPRAGASSQASKK